MVLQDLLNQFYKDNELPENGGIDKETFEMKVLGLNIKLPNPTFRKKVIHIHDIQHVLNQCDVSWKGEGFIAGWELATKFWKHFPICIFSLWAMGYSLWLYPKSVFNGYKKGLHNIGIIDLKVSESDFMKMEFDELVRITTKKKKTKFGLLQWMGFLFWVVCSQIVFLFPMLVILLAFILIVK